MPGPLPLASEAPATFHPYRYGCGSDERRQNGLQLRGFSLVGVNLTCHDLLVMVSLAEQRGISLVVTSSVLPVTGDGTIRLVCDRVELW